MDAAKHALLLLAVDPGLQGALIGASPGSAKSVLSRSFASLLPGAPFVEVPPGATDDRLLGSLNLERTLLTGQRHRDDGLLARAHRGILYVEGLNRLPRSLARPIADALNSGVVRLEREGLSAEFPSEFALIGTCDPAESEVPASLADALGLFVTEAGGSSNEERIEILRRVAAFDRDPRGFARRFAAPTAALEKRIAQARGRLPKVKMKRDDLRRLSVAALQLGVEGHRADLFAVRAARARAALMARASVAPEDLDAAIELVLMPRATALPQPRASAPPEPETASANRPSRPALQSDLAPQERMQPPNGDQIVEPFDCNVPEDILTLPRQSLPQRPTGHSGRRNHPAEEKLGSTRGRFVRAVSRTDESGKIALAATVRAAAPYQILRAAARPQNQHRPGSSNTSAPRVLRISPGDLRFKQFQQKAGMLVIFAVDSSGSMAANRIHLAKGALLRLLEKAYLHRDTVALIGFRGDAAELLLPPTRSVERAKRLLSTLPVGGGTPLASGLEAALALARHSRPEEARQRLLVLVTDGTANVMCRNNPLASTPERNSREAIWREIAEVSALLRREQVDSVVIDTRHRHVSGGEARKLAALLGGRHVHLPRPDSAAAYDAVSAARRNPPNPFRDPSHYAASLRPVLESQLPDSRR